MFRYLRVRTVDRDQVLDDVLGLRTCEWGFEVTLDGAFVGRVTRNGVTDADASANAPTPDRRLRLLLAAKAKLREEGWR